MTQYRRTFGAQYLADRRRHLTREHHLKTIVANEPAHQFASIRGNDGAEAVELDAMRFAGDQGGRATVTPQAERDELLQLVGFPQMQRAEFDIDDQDARFAFRADDVPGQFQGVYR